MHGPDGHVQSDLGIHYRGTRWEKCDRLTLHWTGRSREPDARNNLRACYDWCFVKSDGEALREIEHFSGFAVSSLRDPWEDRDLEGYLRFGCRKD